VNARLRARKSPVTYEFMQAWAGARSIVIEGEDPGKMSNCLRASDPRWTRAWLTISEPKRHRSKEHLRFVAQQPCLICGRTPAQAHHIRYAQSRGLGLKVSYEFTVPLCSIHHTEIHTARNERAWWQERKLDPLPMAQQLWRRTHRASRVIAPATSPESPTSSEPQHDQNAK
jgi:hypothetical protein